MNSPTAPGRPAAARTHVIAEMACSHEGDPALGRRIIDGAGRARADSIQFQVWSLADLAVPHHPDHAKLSRIELGRDDWRGLADHARGRFPEMQIIACVYERPSVDFCETLGAEAYKIHSSDLSNPRLLAHVAGTGKRIDLSVGASTLDEIQDALECIRRVAGVPVWLMYGYQVFPTPTDAVRLGFLKKLKELFELPVGYQDHSDAETPAAFWLPAAAGGIGVDVLEKHITHDRSLKGIDHESALNPDEFGRFVEMVREIDAARGVAVPAPFPPEMEAYRRKVKKALVATRPLPAGTVVADEDLAPMQAGEPGVPPDRAGRLVGRRTRRDIPAHHPVQEEDVS